MSQQFPKRIVKNLKSVFVTIKLINYKVISNSFCILWKNGVLLHNFTTARKMMQWSLKLTNNSENIPLTSYSCEDLWHPILIIQSVINKTLMTIILILGILYWSPINGSNSTILNIMYANVQKPDKVFRLRSNS